MVTLGNFLKNLNNLDKAVEYPMQEMFLYILIKVADLQAPDTGYARALIVMGMAKKLNMTNDALIDNLKEFHFWWEKHGYPENSSRHWTTDVENDSSIVFKNNLFSWSTTDEGILRQQLISAGSKNVETRSGYYPRGHIDIVAQRFNDGKYKDIQQRIDKELSKFIDYYLEQGKPLKAGVK